MPTKAPTARRWSILSSRKSGRKRAARPNVWNATPPASTRRRATYEEGGVGCLTCHSPVPADHPDNMIPTDVSSRNCGTCHVDTLNELEVSQHGKENMNCNQCHNPHTTELRAEHSQALCQSCHHQETHYYSQTGHAKEGLLCTDCHLRVDSTAELGEGHAMSNHTFAVDLQTCNQCHADAAHPDPATRWTTISGSAGDDVTCYPGQVIMQTAPVVPVPEAAEVTEEPAPHISPLLYILPGLVSVWSSVLVAAPAIASPASAAARE